MDSTKRQELELLLMVLRKYDVAEYSAPDGAHIVLRAAQAQPGTVLAADVMPPPQELDPELRKVLARLDPVYSDPALGLF